METEKIEINSIPAVIYGDNSDKLCLFVHGKCGMKEEGLKLAEIICPFGYRVLAADLPEHGERKNSAEKLVPWQAVPELKEILSYAKASYNNIYLHATSIGAYFSLLAFPEYTFRKALFVSPVANMNKLICNMMTWADVSCERLKAEKEISTDFGETLSWDYSTYAAEHPIEVWNSETAVLYAGHDFLTDRETITAFSEKFGCEKQIYEEGEHWFHTEKQLEVWREFVRRELL